MWRRIDQSVDLGTIDSQLDEALELPEIADTEGAQVDRAAVEEQMRRTRIRVDPRITYQLSPRMTSELRYSYFRIEYGDSESVNQP